jgi:glycosyltransferase involved in cell wall biosynthesis
MMIAHNEEANIGRMIEGLIKSYDSVLNEIVVIDDVSVDRTRQVVEELQKKYKKLRLVVRQEPCGVGRALKAGFLNVSDQSDYVLTMDSDFVDRLDEVQRLIDKIQEGYDGVVGSRFLNGSRLEGYPGPKQFFNRSFHALVHGLLGVPNEDLTNNYKLYRTVIVKTLPWQSNGFAMNAETGLWPVLAGYRVVGVPVSWIGRRQGMGVSDFKILKVGPGYAWVFLKALLYRWTGYLKKFKIDTTSNEFIKVEIKS